MDEAELQRRIEKLLHDEAFSNAITGVDQILIALKQSRDDGVWPCYPIDYLSRVRVAEAAEYVLSRLHALESVSRSTQSLSLASGQTIYADLLYCCTEYATFVLLELKVGEHTPRQAVAELLAYEQEIMNHCPFLSHDDLVFVVIGTEFRATVDHALAGLMTWGRRKVLCLLAEPQNDSVSLQVHLPAAWSPIGQGILPADAVATADLCLYPNDGISGEQIEMLAMTAMDLITRDADRAGSHGFVMLWDDAMHPEVTSCQIVLTVGIVNPFAFLAEAVGAGILVSDRTSVQKYLLETDKWQDLTAAHNWIATVGKSAIAYLNQWCKPTWEGLSTWRDLRSPDRVDGPSHALERRAMPRAFDFFGVMGEHARDLTSRTALRSNFLPSTVRPGVDWKHPRLGAAILDRMTLPEVIPMGQWTFGALFDLGLRLGRFATTVEAYRRADEKTKAKLAARLFWAEADMWEPLHALQDRCNCTDEMTTPPPKIIFGGYNADREAGAEVQALAQWIADHFIGKRSQLLRIGFSLGLESHGLYDAAIAAEPNGVVRKEYIVKIAGVARDFLLASVDRLLADGVSENERVLLWRTLENDAEIELPQRLPVGKLEGAIKGIPDERAVNMLPGAIVPLVDSWCPQLGHRLAPAKLTGFDWVWIKEQVVALRSQGVEHPGVMLSPNGEVITTDFAKHGRTLPAIPDSNTHVLACVHAGFAEYILAMSWTKLENDGFSQIEKLIWDIAGSQAT